MICLSAVLGAAGWGGVCRAGEPETSAADKPQREYTSRVRMHAAPFDMTSPTEEKKEEPVRKSTDYSAEPVFIEPTLFEPVTPSISPVSSRRMEEEEDDRKRTIPLDGLESPSRGSESGRGWGWLADDMFERMDKASTGPSSDREREESSRRSEDRRTERDARDERRSDSDRLDPYEDLSRWAPVPEFGADNAPRRSREDERRDDENRDPYGTAYEEQADGESGDPYGHSVERQDDRPAAPTTWSERATQIDTASPQTYFAETRRTMAELSTVQVPAWQSTAARATPGSESARGTPASFNWTEQAPAAAPGVPDRSLWSDRGAVGSLSQPSRETFGSRPSLGGAADHQSLFDKKSVQSYEPASSLAPIEPVGEAGGLLLEPGVKTRDLFQ